MITLDPKLVLAARTGNRAALAEVVRTVERPIFNLSMRMLANRADAEDATQEILIKIITHLGTLREVEAAGGWALKVASRHLVHERRKGRVEAMRLTFDAFAEDLADGAAPGEDSGLSAQEFALAVKEVKIGCTMAMLLCLSRDLRIAYVLGEIFELSDTEASAALDIAPTTFRQRLKRARDGITAFMSETCGLAGAGAGSGACRCERRVVPALAQGRISLTSPEGIAPDTIDLAQLRRQVERLEAGRRASSLMRSNPDFTSNVGGLTLRVLDESVARGPNTATDLH